MAPGLLARPLAVEVFVPLGPGTCVDGLGGYFDPLAVLLLSGFVFDAVELPLDWQPTSPATAIKASVYRARWIAMARMSFWNMDIEKGRNTGALRPPCRTEVI